MTNSEQINIIAENDNYDNLNGDIDKIPEIILKDEEIAVINDHSQLDNEISFYDDELDIIFADNSKFDEFGDIEIEVEEEEEDVNIIVGEKQKEDEIEADDDDYSIEYEIDDDLELISFNDDKTLPTEPTLDLNLGLKVDPIEPEVVEIDVSMIMGNNEKKNADFDPLKFESRLDFGDIPEEVVKV